MGEHNNNHFFVDLSALQQLKLEDLLKSFSGLQSWNDLLTLSELTDKVALSEETKSLYTVRTFEDGRSQIDLSRMTDNSQIELSSSEKRMLLRVINESVGKLTCGDVQWISSIRKQVAE